jgi:hypothetical protein
MRLKRIYADTSVYGGVFDVEFSSFSKVFFDKVRYGKFQLIISDIVEKEIRDAPLDVRALYNEMLLYAEVIENMDEAVALQQVYLHYGIVGSGAMADALHVAAATVSNCRILLSWNLKHIVNYQKIPLYNGINRTEGYQEIDIYTPLEVIYDEEDV